MSALVSLVASELDGVAAAFRDSALAMAFDRSLMERRMNQYDVTHRKLVSRAWYNNRKGRRALRRMAVQP